MGLSLGHLSALRVPRRGDWAVFSDSGLLSAFLSLQVLHFLFEQFTDSVPGEVNLSETHAQVAAHLSGAHTAQHIAVKYLKLARINTHFHPLGGGFDEVELPLALPNSVKTSPRGVGQGVGGGVSGATITPGGEMLRRALAELVGNSPAGDVPQPALEGALFLIVTPIAGLLGYAENGLLHDVPSLFIIQAGLGSHAVNEAPLGAVEDIPALLVVPVMQALYQAATRVGSVLLKFAVIG